MRRSALEWSAGVEQQRRTSRMRCATLLGSMVNDSWVYGLTSRCSPWCTTLGRSALAKSTLALCTLHGETRWRTPSTTARAESRRQTPPRGALCLESGSAVVAKVAVAPPDRGVSHHSLRWCHLHTSCHSNAPCEGTPQANSPSSAGVMQYHQRGVALLAPQKDSHDAPGSSR